MAGQYTRVQSIYKNEANCVEVFEVVVNESNTPAILKVVRTNNLEEVNEILHEAWLQHSLAHPNVCKVLDVFLSAESMGNCFNIVLEKLGKDLAADTKARKTNNCPFTEPELVSFVQQVGSALKFGKDRVTVTQGVAHRDIKPANILMTNDRTYKLADFGSAKRAMDKFASHTLVGTPLFLSPQLLEALSERIRTGSSVGTKYNPFKSDVFSLGLTIVHLATLSPPTGIGSLPGLEGKLEALVQTVGYSEWIKELIRRMLKVREEDRISIEDVLSYVEAGQGGRQARQLEGEQGGQWREQGRDGVQAGQWEGQPWGGQVGGQGGQVGGQGGQGGGQAWQWESQGAGGQVWYPPEQKSNPQHENPPYQYQHYFSTAQVQPTPITPSCSPQPSYPLPQQFPPDYSGVTPQMQPANPNCYGEGTPFTGQPPNQQYYYPSECYQRAPAGSEWQQGYQQGTGGQPYPQHFQTRSQPYSPQHKKEHKSDICVSCNRKILSTEPIQLPCSGFICTTMCLQQFKQNGRRECPTCRAIIPFERYCFD